MIKKAIAALVCGAVAAGSLVSCGKKLPVTSTTAGESTGTYDSQNGTQEAFVATDIANFTAPEKGDQIIIMNIKDYGEVKIRLFPDYAPEGVENFVTLASQGYYDGLIFHRVIDEFMIQGGDPLGNGTGGQSCWGGKFDGGTDPHLIHVAGALAYANSGALVPGGSPTASDGSQFYIVTGRECDDSYFETLESYGYTFTDEQKELYKQCGGYPSLDGNYTIFGQVIDGLDIIFAIQKVATDANNKPVEDVIMESVKVGTYDGEEIRFYSSDYDLSGIGDATPSQPDADYDNAALAAKTYLEAYASKDAEAVYDQFGAAEISGVNDVFLSRVLESQPDFNENEFNAMVDRSAVVNFFSEQIAADVTADGLVPKIDTESVYIYSYDDIETLQRTLMTYVDAAIVYENCGLVAPDATETYVYQPKNPLIVLKVNGEWHVSYLWQAYDFFEAKFISQ